MCGFIAQLVEHRTGIAEVTGSNPVEALIFSGFFFLIAEIGKLSAMIILHSHLQPQFKYELFHIYFTRSSVLYTSSLPMTPFNFRTTSLYHRPDYLRYLRSAITGWNVVITRQLSARSLEETSSLSFKWGTFYKDLSYHSNVMTLTDFLEIWPKHSRNNKNNNNNFNCTQHRNCKLDEQK